MKNKSKDSISEKELLIEISNKLSTLSDLFAVNGKPKEDQIKALVSKGYSNSDISELLCIPKGTIDSIRANQKKGNNK